MFTVYLPLLTIFFATVVSMLVVLYCLGYVRRYGVTQQVMAFTIFAAAVTIWALFAMLQLTATTYESTFLAYQLLHFGAWGTPIPLLFYALSVGPAGRWVTRSVAAALTLTVVPLFVLLFTAPTQYLFIEPTLQPLGSFSVIEHGNQPLYDAYLVWIYLLVFPALGYIAYQAGTDETMSRGQSGLVVLSVLFPVLISVGQTLSVPLLDTPGTILTPLSLSLGMSGLGYAVFRYETFDAKLRARSRTIERMQEGYLLVDPDNRIIDTNATAREILGGERPLAGTDIEDALSNYGAHAPVGDSSTTFETDVVRGDTVMTVETSASRLVRNGQLVGTLCVFRDITERKQYQRDLQNQRDSLELLNTVVRHDIRNDVAVISRLGRALERDVTADGHTYLQQLRERGEHITDLTTSLRDLMETMLGEDQGLRPVRADTMIRYEVEQTAIDYEQASIEIMGELPEATVQANQLLSSVLQNLLKNAIRHNDSATPTVTVSARERGDSVIITIADNGPGIPDDVRAEMFTKGSKALDSGGMGLGLYLVSTLVDRYGGDIWVEENEPRGTVFSVELRS